jgi:protein-S-isoprenylcysteine O-methyltransferase Ste14
MHAVRLSVLFYLAALAAFATVAIGWRSWLQYRRTGKTGLPGLPRTGWEWVAGILLVLGADAAAAAPLADFAGLVPRFELLDRPWIQIGAAVVFALGFLLVITSQLQMGDSWRINVDAEAKAPLVTHGIFRFVRNPIFSGVIIVWTGLALAVANLLSLAAVVLVVLGFEVQIRKAEEPYLERLHGEPYRAYAAKAGRFFPGIGRLSRGANRPGL